MSLMMMVSLIGPVVAKVLTSVWTRMTGHGISSVIGLGAGGAIVAFLQSIGCNLSLANQAVLGALGAAPGLLGTDAGQIAPGLFAAAMDHIEQEKKSRAVLEAARAEQAKFAAVGPGTTT